MPRWNGQEYPGHIPDDIFRQVLDEIFKESFKQELLLADSIFYKLKPGGFDDTSQERAEVGEVQEFDVDLDASTHEDRNVKVMAWIPGLMNGSEFGFDSLDLAARRRSAYALFRVMLGWTKMPSFPRKTEAWLHNLAPGCNISDSDVVEACFQVCFHYVASYADYFERAPMVPHTLIGPISAVSS